jgi:hypothetical protein
MLKLTMCVSRSPRLSREQFDAYWRDHHGPLVRPHQQILRIRRYVQTSPLADAMAQEAIRASRGMLNADFDGYAELWWDSFEDHAARTTAEGAAVLRALIEDERKFVDFSRSQAW